jgi:hypothetical protein
MSFKESFETVSKEEIVLYNDIDNKEDATEKNTKKLYYEKLLEKNEPNIAELITKYKMEIDYDDKEVVVPFKIEFSNG